EDAVARGLALAAIADVAALEAEVRLGGRHLLGLLLRLADRARPFVGADRHRNDKALVVIGPELLHHAIGRRGAQARLRGLLQPRLEVVEPLELDRLDPLCEQPPDELPR